MSESSSDEDVNFRPVEFVQTVHNAELSFLPEKSREKYLKAYDLFVAWTHSQGAETLSEAIMLSYFTELSKTRQSSTLWSIYSMLKATIRTKRGIHIERYPKLVAFLKKTASGHKPKKSKIFTASNIEQFLNEAHDSEHLATKVVLIIGVSGACRTNELTFLTTKNVEKHSEKLILVNLPNTRTNINRNFVIRDEYVKIIEKYQALRPAKTPIDRFFLQYRKGKCTGQPMGTTKIGGFPREIATFLGLKDPEKYTGHCFRRTSASLLADSGADLTMLKRQGGRPSSALTEEYKEDSREIKSTCNVNKEIGEKKHESISVKDMYRQEVSFPLPQSTQILKDEIKLEVEILPVDGDSDLVAQDDSSTNDSVDDNETLNVLASNTSEVSNLEKHDLYTTEQARNSTQIPFLQQDATQISDLIMASPSTSTSTINSPPARKRQTPEMRAEYLEIEKKKLRIMELELSRNSDPYWREQKSEDYHFLMSILPNMEQLPPIQKMRLRNKINQAVLEEMELLTYGEQYGYKPNYGTGSRPDTQ